MERKKEHTPREWLGALIDATPGIKITRLSRAMDMDPSYLSKVVAGKARLRPEHIAILSAHLEKPEAYFFQMEKLAPSVAVPTVTPPLAEVAVHRKPFAHQGFRFDNPRIGGILVTPDNKAAIEMPNHSMRDRIRRGDVLVYHVTALPRVNDIVIAVLPDGDFIVRELTEIVGDHLTLRSLHPKAERSLKPVRTFRVLWIALDPPT